MHMHVYTCIYFIIIPRVRDWATKEVYTYANQRIYAGQDTAYATAQPPIDLIWQQNVNVFCNHYVAPQRVPYVYTRLYYVWTT